MNFNDQDRQCVVTLSAALGLARWAQRCFPFAEFTLERSEGLRASAPALSMTVPVLVVKVHNRGPSINRGSTTPIRIPDYFVKPHYVHAGARRSEEHTSELQSQ